MSDILVLMRHGKAERPEEGKLDMERRLTEAGKRALAATLPQSLGLMPRNADVQVWSSPAARAEQSARILMRACQRAGVKVDPQLELVDTLWSQMPDAFLESVRACPADVVVAVGHNPFVEDVVLQLTGSHVICATGALVAVSLKAEGSQSMQPGQNGRLLWLAQGPISQHWKTLAHMQRVLATAADTVQTRRQQFLDDPQDIETMHKFRVSIRTLRSLLAFVAPWQDPVQNKEAQKLLKKTVAETSRLRELDVLTEQAEEMEGASPEFVEYCSGLAAAERERVFDVLSTKRTAKDLNRVSKALHNVKWRKGVAQAGLPQADVRARFDELTAELQDELAVLDLADAELTHDVRKNAKRVRYDAEKFKELVGEDAVGIAKSMTEHQDNLGAICDARVNIDIISALPTKDLPEPVAWDLALLRAQNETYLYTALRDK